MTEEGSVNDRNLAHHAYTSYAQIGLQSIFLTNGGAAVALLAFFGSADPAIKSLIIKPEDGKSAMVYFAVGVASGVLATMLAYLTEWISYTKQSKQAQPIVGAAAWLLAFIGGFLFFILGCLRAMGIFGI